ncbi:hypothetical protein Q5H91_13875 [Sphingomonas sp. KR1UV-12]|uniref:Transposase n=1 Tax=Sphingomonas aurea TaxID=3063994 RepID=A0ABT9EMX7_9SPHN|nr:hypothetical protein [Sphingomonas sp. KR1UV-12]MDP1028307.1 hypothetical protein [Sphingomonas sp. KR1UV-12]
MLIERHPETYLNIEKLCIFPQQSLWRFTRGGRYKALQDNELNRHVRNLKRLNAVAIVAWLVFGIGVFTAPMS